MQLPGKCIVVTGGAGFLGMHLIAQLTERGCTNVHVPRSADCDLVDAGATRAYFEAVRPDVVFHLAARVGGIGANEKNPGSYFHDNITMGINVLEQGRRAAVQKTIMVGTICSYPKFSSVPFREDDLWNGYPEETNAPYGIAKKALMVMADAYHRQYGTQSVCLLPVNLYGPHDNFDLETSHVIPAMIRKFLEAKRRGAPHVVLWGDGTPTREFLYVDDCAEALIMAAERHDDCAPVNVGAGFEIAMRDLAARIARLVGYGGAIHWDVTRPNGQPRRMLDTRLARERFGFSARTALDEGLAKTVAWYQSTRNDL